MSKEQTDQKIMPVSVEEFEKLHQIWRAGNRAGNSIGTIEDFLKDNRDIKRGWPIGGRLLLYGRVNPQTEETCEDCLGYLKAIAPGVVVFDSTIFKGGFLNSLSGILTRDISDAAALFVIPSFSETGAISIFWPATFPRDRYLKFGCPVYVNWGLDRDTDGNIFIDPDRWNKVMLPWLDRWLPADTSTPQE